MDSKKRHSRKSSSRARGAHPSACRQPARIFAIAIGIAISIGCYILIFDSDSDSDSDSEQESVIVPFSEQLFKRLRRTR